MATKGYNLEQTGEQVQAALNKAINLGPATEETDGLMTATDKASLEHLNSVIDTKVDKVTGKGLSTNDFTNEDKGKLDTAYQVPSTGIPAADMSSGVQTSLNKANTAVQPADLVPITEKIPAQASAQNQLADKAFVNSSISTASADFKGTYDSLAELQAVTADKNDYGYVVSTDEAGNTVYSRYKYNGSAWVFEYDLNNSSFTAAEWASIQSQITAALVQKLSALPTNQELGQSLSGKQDTIQDLSTIRSGAAAGATAYQKPGTGIPSTDMASAVQTSLGKADTAYQKPSGGVPKSDLASSVQTSISKADTAIQPAEFNELEEEVRTIGNGAYEEAWDGSSAPVVADIPAGVSVTYNSTSYTGTLAASASTVDKIYLVSDGNGNYDRYTTVEANGAYSWKKVGSTAIPLSNYATETEVSQLQQKVGDLSQLMTEDKSSLVAAINESGFSGAAKTALVELLRKVAFIVEDGQDYLNAFYAYLFPDMLSIDAVFTQGQATIYESDDLATLKQYLVVTALYQDGTSLVLPDNAYTLLGTLEEGTSTITVTYGDKSDTFDVIVSPPSRESLFGVFSNGYAVQKVQRSNVQKCSRTSTSARATTHDPFVNNGYIFTVTDSSKYNIAVYDIQSIEKSTTDIPTGSIDGYAYVGGNKSIAWKAEDSVSTPYCWVVLKKMDGTAFTDAELADGAAAVFTYTKGN